MFRSWSKSFWFTLNSFTTLMCHFEKKKNLCSNQIRFWFMLCVIDARIILLWQLLRFLCSISRSRSRSCSPSPDSVSWRTHFQTSNWQSCDFFIVDITAFTCCCSCLHLLACPIIKMKSKFFHYHCQFRATFDFVYKCTWKKTAKAEETKLSWKSRDKWEKMAWKLKWMKKNSHIHKIITEIGRPNQALSVERKAQCR